MSLRAALAALLTASASCAPPGQDAREPDATPGETAKARYVGDGVCADCHAEETRLWNGSHHDLAMQPATDSTVLGDFDEARFDHSGITSVFTRRGDEYRVRTDGPDGAVQEFRVTHTFGAEPLQQYLAELPGGRLQALAIAWDARPAEAGGQRWFHLRPGETIDHEDPLHWTRTSMNWNTSCAACHSTGLVKGYSAEQDTFATEWAGIDVDCEACHGPGSLHAAAPSEAPLHLGPDPRAWVFAPDAPIAERRPAADDTAEIEVCAQCHSRRAQIAEAFTAGDPLLDDFVPALLDAELYHADGQILGEVFEYGSFLQSAMHAAGVTCSDCHEPHSAELRADGNALCAGCHEANVYDAPRHHRHADGAAGSACVDCHMRAETYMVVDPRRDHSFRVPRPDLSVVLGTPNACNDCHDEHSPEWAAARVAEWHPDGRGGEFHYGQAIHAGREWTAQRMPLLARVFGDRDTPAIVRATSLRLIAAHPDAAALDAIERALADDELVQLAALESLDALPMTLRVDLAQGFLTHPQRALRTTAAAALAGARDRLSERRRADLDAALDEYVAVQAFNGDRSEGLFNRANVLAATGRLEEAEAAFAAAIDQEPAFSPAHVNLADLYRRLGREEDARRALERGLAAHPDDPALRYALGLSLVRSGRLDEALPELRRAAELGADEPRYAYAYGVGLLSADEQERALDVLTAAANRFPGHPPTLFALAALHRDRGDPRAALDWTQRLLEVSPADAGGRALRKQLEAAASSAP